MNGDVFGRLLTCGVCSHVIGEHDGSGCRMNQCTCTCTSQAVLEANVKVYSEDTKQQIYD